MALTLKKEKRFDRPLIALCPNCNRETHMGYFVHAACFSCRQKFPFTSRAIIDSVNYRMNYYLGHLAC